MTSYELRCYEWTLTEENCTVNTNDDKLIEPQTIGAIMGIMALLAPVSFNVHSPPNGGFLLLIVAVGWSLEFKSPDILEFRFFDINAMILPLLISFLRVVFVHQMVRYYQGKSTRNRAIRIGILAELQTTLISIPLLLSMLLSPDRFIPQIVGPVPVLLLVGLGFMKFTPPLQPSILWKEDKEIEHWWKQQLELVFYRFQNRIQILWQTLITHLSNR
jgi:hypothetical protein